MYIHSLNLRPQLPEYCRNMEETDIVDQAFSLIFAFDEIVALGYRENVNLAQIRTFTEMDSHEEKVFQAVRQVSVSILPHEKNYWVVIKYFFLLMLLMK